MRATRLIVGFAAMCGMILIAGAAGALGPHTVSDYLREGWEIKGIPSYPSMEVVLQKGDQVVICHLVDKPSEYSTYQWLPVR
jgi:nucleoside-diphosphate-sugar epimerase